MEGSWGSRDASIYCGIGGLVLGSNDRGCQSLRQECYGRSCLASIVCYMSPPQTIITLECPLLCLACATMISSLSSPSTEIAHDGGAPEHVARYGTICFSIIRTTDFYHTIISYSTWKILSYRTSTINYRTVISY